MTTVQVPGTFTHVLRRLQSHPRQPFYEIILATFGVMASRTPTAKPRSSSPKLSAPEDKPP